MSKMIAVATVGELSGGNEYEIINESRSHFMVRTNNHPNGVWYVKELFRLMILMILAIAMTSCKKEILSNKKTDTNIMPSARSGGTVSIYSGTNITLTNTDWVKSSNDNISISKPLFLGTNLMYMK